MKKARFDISDRVALSSFFEESDNLSLKKTFIWNISGNFACSFKRTTDALEKGTIINV